MEQKCYPSAADIESTGCHSNIKLTTATTANTPEQTQDTTASFLRSLQMSSKDPPQQQQLQLQSHNNVSDKKMYESFESSKLNGDDNRGCSISMSTPAADNITLFKDEDSRSGSSDDITSTPILELHHHNLHKRLNHYRHQNGKSGADDDDEDTTTTTTSSTNTIEVIQDHRGCPKIENTGGVGVGIYLETPVIDEQIVSLNSHDYEKAKPKRLSDEFLLSSEDCCDEERNSSNDSNPLATANHSNSSNKIADCNISNNSNSSEILKNSGILNDLLRSVMTDEHVAIVDGGIDGVVDDGYCESQFDGVDEDVNIPAAAAKSTTTTTTTTAAAAAVAASGSMSFRFQNISIDYNPFDKVNGDSDDVGSSQAATDVLDNDVQSMDAIERRDFEHEQRLTGGIILKSSSYKNDRLKLELVQPTNVQHTNNQQRAVSSDSKCTYKDHSTTPTSSRHCSSRLTKSTAKINLTTSLSHPEITTNEDDQDHKENQNHPQQQNGENELDCNSSSSPDNHHHKVQQPEPSKSILASTSSASLVEEVSEAATATAAAASTSGRILKSPSKLRSKEGAVKGIFEIFTNSSSNDSLASENSYSTSSSHSLSHLTKQQQQQQQQQQQSQQPGCSGVSRTNSLNREEDDLPILLKKALVKCGMLPKAEIVNEDDVATTSSSARCQYPALKYIRNSQRKDSTSAVNGDDGAKLSSVTVEERKNYSTPLVSAMFGMSSNNSHSNFQQQLNHQHDAAVELPSHLEDELHENDFDEETWADCEEGTDEEACTCHKYNYANQSKRDSSDLLTDDAHSKDELSSYIQMVSISEDTLSHEQSMSPEFSGLQRKRKFNETTRLVDTDSLLGDTVSGRKRIAYDYSSTPRSSQSLLIIASPSTPLGRRTPRSLIPTRDNPPPELQDWLLQFQRWSHAERLLAVDRLIEHCEPTQVRHMMKVIEPQFQRDFISLLPRELALQVLAYLDPKDLLRAAQTCRSWRFLCDDNLLWKEKCRKAQILTEPKTDRPKRGRAGNMPPIASPWKAAYMRQHIIEMNWRSRPIREPKVLKGHDDHVITCLQFSGNRIVSGSDDNTLKVWSAVTGRCLRTLVGHTGGVWSSQMSGNIIISGSTDRTLKVWDMETGQCVHTLMGHTSTVRCMHLHGKKVVSGSRDATLRVWDIERGACLHVLVGHLAAVRCVQYDGKLIVSGAYDYMVKIWHPERQECLHTLQGHTNRVYSLQFDGIHVVSGSLDTSIRVWDVETGNCKHTLMGHQSLTSGMELRQNILVSGNADSTVKVWDITSGQCLQTLSGPNKHQSAVTCLQFNSRFVITSSDDGTVKLWDVKTGEFIRNLVALDSGGSGGVVWRIRANDTKLICAVGSRNGTEETKLMVLDFDVEGACVKCS